MKKRMSVSLAVVALRSPWLIYPIPGLSLLCRSRPHACCAFFNLVCRGQASDAYALGACLFTFVFGRIPFTAATVAELFETVKKQELTFPDAPTISAELRDLLQGLLCKDPDARLTLDDVFTHPWTTNNGAMPPVLRSTHTKGGKNGAARRPDEDPAELALAALLTPSLEVRKFERGQVLLRQGDRCGDMLYIIQGQVEVLYRQQGSAGASEAEPRSAAGWRPETEADPSTVEEASTPQPAGMSAGAESDAAGEGGASGSASRDEGVLPDEDAPSTPLGPLPGSLGLVGSTSSREGSSPALPKAISSRSLSGALRGANLISPLHSAQRRRHPATQVPVANSRFSPRLATALSGSATPDASPRLGGSSSSFQIGLGLGKASSQQFGSVGIESFATTPGVTPLPSARSLSIPEGLVNGGGAGGLQQLDQWQNGSFDGVGAAPLTPSGMLPLGLAEDSSRSALTPASRLISPALSNASKLSAHPLMLTSRAGFFVDDSQQVIELDGDGDGEGAQANNTPLDFESSLGPTLENSKTPTVPSSGSPGKSAAVGRKASLSEDGQEAAAAGPDLYAAATDAERLIGTLARGKDFLLAQRGPGDFIGETGLIGGSSLRRSCTIRAASEEVSVAVIPYAVAKAHFRLHPLAKQRLAEVVWARQSESIVLEGMLRLAGIKDELA